MTRHLPCAVLGAVLGAALAAGALAPAAAFAHHSRAAYDQTREVTFEGVVARLDWKNPHIFLTLETKGEDGAPVLQEIEATSVSEARALGLTPEAIAPGARVAVRANPGRRGPGSRAVGIAVTTADGAVVPLNTDARLSVAPDIAAAADGVAGHWVPSVASFGGLVAVMGSLQLTEAGQAAAPRIREMFADPHVAALGICEPFPPPGVSVYPEVHAIEVEGSTVVMRFEGGVGVPMQRVVHLDQTEHPAGVEPSLMGHSIGHWEDGALVIDTVAFAPHRLGVLFYPSGPDKHLVERFALAPDRRHLQYTFTVEDPSILAAPFTFTATWDYRPDLEPSGEACDPEVARRALER